MRNLQHHGTHGLTHVELRPAGHAYVRWFRYPLGPIRPDGQPERDWDWFVAIEMHGDTLWAFGAKGIPSMDEFRDVLRAAALLGAWVLAFEHRSRIHFFDLSKYHAPSSLDQGVGAVTSTDPNPTNHHPKYHHECQS